VATTEDWFNVKTFGVARLVFYLKKNWCFTSWQAWLLLLLIRIFMYQVVICKMSVFLNAAKSIIC